MNYSLFAFLCAFAAVATCDEEYFWRDWVAGSPPSDAISVRDFKGASYIVEAYAPKYGLYIGQIFTNQHDVNVSVLHANVSTKIQKGYTPKVLCAQIKDLLAWYPTNSKTLGTELLSGLITPVVGGLSDEDEVLYIGRYVDVTTRAVQIGSIDNLFQLNYQNSGKSFTELNYEILIVVKDKCHT